jgi:YbbR domain-containing protein
MDRILAAFRDVGAMLGALVAPVLRSFRQNSGLAVLSVVLAFGVWIVVSNAENPETTRVVPVDIPVEPVNVESDVAVDSLVPAVIQVRVRVEEDVLDTLTAADFEATVDLQGLNVGEFSLDVEVRPLTGRGGLRIEDVLPAATEVTIVQLALKVCPWKSIPLAIRRPDLLCLCQSRREATSMSKDRSRRCLR